MKKNVFLFLIIVLSFENARAETVHDPKTGALLSSSQSSAEASLSSQSADKSIAGPWRLDVVVSEAQTISIDLDLAPVPSCGVSASAIFLEGVDSSVMNRQVQWLNYASQQKAYFANVNYLMADKKKVGIYFSIYPNENSDMLEGTASIIPLGAKKPIGENLKTTLTKTDKPTNLVAKKTMRVNNAKAIKNAKVGMIIRAPEWGSMEGHVIVDSQTKTFAGCNAVLDQKSGSLLGGNYFYSYLNIQAMNFRVLKTGKLNAYIYGAAMSSDSEIDFFNLQISGKTVDIESSIYEVQ